ncbi:MAG: endonuclease domain-containing protein [Bacteroidetes bacterium]|nr:endonuclease domain-containing protein [Bacteroidota bacterium]
MTYHTNPRLGYPIYSDTDPLILKMARENRKNLTPAERKLWEFLRKKKIIGMKFRRQHPVSRFIADFYCHQAKLIVEVDGGYHNDPEQVKYDKGRQNELENIGLMTIRFRNDEIEMDIQGVIERIKSVLQGRLRLQNPISSAPFPMTL